ncbi:MAG: hypothetical protein Q9M50_04450 [Methylococcales bacterium]|nr:hypothetical protein [Methylococcales bacterium]
MIKSKIFGGLRSKKISFCYALLAIALLLMHFMGQHQYTSFGVDHDIRQKNHFLHLFVRLRYPGDGSVWVGGSGRFRSLSSSIIESFDLAGAFFKKPRPPQPKTIANHYGFWLITNAQDNPFTSTNPWSFWLAVPGWLPVLVLIMMPVYSIRSKNRE